MVKNLDCQEFLLADNPIFVCGSQTYEGTQIISGISLFLLGGAIDVHLGFSSEPEGIGEDFDAAKYFDALRSLVFRKRIPELDPSFYPVQSLVDFVYNYQGMACTDPRDKVYAMLGIATDDMAGLNAPDYSLSMLEVLERLFVTWTESRKTLDIVTYRPQRTRPTWRPSFVSSQAIKLPLLLSQRSRRYTDLLSISSGGTRLHDMRR